jgi:hypothetical protein
MQGNSWTTVGRLLRVAASFNTRLKDEFGGNTLRVKGAPKVMAHLMFSILALAADQLITAIAYANIVNPRRNSFTVNGI